MKKQQWWDKSWNPIDGCTPKSESCSHCWAASMAKRFWDRPFSEIKFHPDRLDQPLKWKKPRRVFVCSMGDLFHEDALQHWDYVVDAMQTAYWHHFLLLTKRPENALKVWYLDMPKRIYLGVSAENQQTADERIPILLQIPATKRFVSLEPMLGPVDLHYVNTNIDVLWGPERIDWIIVGGLSLPGGKVQAPDSKWVDSIVEQCDNSEIPIFIKENAQYHTKREEFPE